MWAGLLLLLPYVMIHLWRPGEGRREGGGLPQAKPTIAEPRPQMDIKKSGFGIIFSAESLLKDVWYVLRLEEEAPRGEVLPPSQLRLS